MRANESGAALIGDELTISMDKEIFIHNLADLLSQTKENVRWISLTDDEEYAVIYFTNGRVENVWICNCDSYVEIAKSILFSLTDCEDDE